MLQSSLGMSDNPRRDFFKAAATAAFTTSIFTGSVKGANDRVRTAFIGTGRMGRGNMQAAMKQDKVEIPTVCDVYKPNLEQAVQMTEGKAKGIKDFREILADKSIDAVCISTPDHWHAYMTVEACKHGKDVYVEKPICVTVDVQAFLVVRVVFSLDFIHFVDGCAYPVIERCVAVRIQTIELGRQVFADIACASASQ